MTLLRKLVNSDPVTRARMWLVFFALGLDEKSLQESVLDPYLDTKELAEVLGCHPETVRRLSRERKIHGINVGGVWRYRWSEVEEDLRAWTDRRWNYYSERRHEAHQAKLAKRRRRAAGLQVDEDE